MLLLSKYYTIKFQEEFFYGKDMSCVLIGLSDADQESVYVWVDGRIADYLNWSPGEPRSNANNEDCVGIHGPRDTYYGMWFDCATHWATEFLCEHKLRQIEGNDDII